MAKQKAAVEAGELDGSVVTSRPTDELGALTFVDPLLRLVQQALGPFVAHRSDCEADPCTCGLAAALVELQRREILVRRYGVID